MERMNSRLGGREAGKDQGWSANGVETGWSDNDPVMMAWLETQEASLHSPLRGGGEENMQVLANQGTPKGSWRGALAGSVSTPGSAATTRSGLSCVVYDKDNAIEAIQLLFEGVYGDSTDNGLSHTEARGIVKMLKKYIEYADAQRQGMVEREATLSTELSQKQQEVASMKRGYEDGREENKALKRNIKRLMEQEEEIKIEMRNLRSALEFSKQKEDAALEACRKAGEQVEEVKRAAAMKIDGAHKRLQELEVQMHLAGCPSSHNAKIEEDVHDDAMSDETLHEASRVVNERRQANMVAFSRSEKEHITVPPVRETGTDYDKLYKSEMAVLQRKMDKSNTLLNKTTIAAQKLQEKLSQERSKVAALQEEKSQLQAHLLKLQQKPQGMDHKEAGRLIHNLAAARSKVERLNEDRQALSQKLASLQNEMSHASEEQRQALVRAEDHAKQAVLQEQAKCESLQAEVSSLLEKLGEANNALNDLHTTRKSLEESQNRCAELAGALEEEQQSSYERAMEVDRLAKAAQACANELMEIREKLHDEKLRAQRLENENAGLQGRLDAFSEALSAQEHNSEVLESLVEGRALVQSRLKQAESERGELQEQNANLESKIASMEGYIQELEDMLDSLHEDLAKSEAAKSKIEADLQSNHVELQTSCRRNGELEGLLESSKSRCHEAEEAIQALKKQLDDKTSALDQVHNDVLALKKELFDSEQKLVIISNEKCALAKENENLQTHMDELRRAMTRFEQTVEESKNKNLNLESSLRAAEAQCDALRSAHSEAQKDSLCMVDSMCEMTSLVDAVTSLQARVHDLQSQLTVSQSQVSKLEDEKKVLMKEVEVCESHLAKSQETMADLRNMSEEDKAKYMQSVRQLDALSLQLETTNKELEHVAAENCEKQSQIVELLAVDASNTEEIKGLKRRIKDLKKSLSASKEQIQSLESEVDAKTNNCNELLEVKAELEASLKATKDSLESSESKLAVAVNRIEKLEEATKHVNALATEFEKLRKKHANLLKEHAQDRQMYDKLSSKYDEAVQRIEKDSLALEGKDAHIQELLANIDKSHRDIEHLKTLADELQDEVSRLSVLEPQIELLKEHIAEGGSWCEAAASTLTARANELQSALSEAGEARRNAISLSEQLSAAQERAAVAEASLKKFEETFTHSEMEKDAALQALDTMKQEIFVLSSQHKEMMDVAEAVKESEQETATKYAEACSQISNLQASMETMRDEIQAHRLKNTEMAIKVEHLEHSKGLQDEEIVSLKRSANTLTKTLEVKESELRECEKELHKMQNICSQLEISLQETSLNLIDRESEIESLEAELNDHKAAIATEKKASEILKDQCGSLEKEISFLQSSLLNDSVTSGQLEEVVKYVGEERSQLRADMAALNKLVDGLRDELNSSRADVRRSQSARDEAEKKITNAIEDNKRLMDRVSCLERDLAVLEVVKDQLEKEIVVERDEATRSKLYCKEAEREVAKLKLDYEIFNQAIDGRLSAFEPILEGIEKSLSEYIVVENEQQPLIDVPGIAEQGDRVLKSLQRIDRCVLNVIGSLDDHIKREASHQEAVKSWAAQQRAFKLVTRLALALAADHISGTDDATLLYNKLKVDVRFESVLQPSGLASVWESLTRLVESQSGLKTAKKIDCLMSELDKATKSVEKIKKSFSDEQKRSSRLERALKDACKTVSFISKSIGEASGDTMRETPFIDGSNPIEELNISIDLLKTSVNIMIRRYRSMARSVRSVKSIKDDGSPSPKVKRNLSNTSGKIPAVKV